MSSENSELPTTNTREIGYWGMDIEYWDCLPGLGWGVSLGTMKIPAITGIIRRRILLNRPCLADA
jgi:hypothetical protein